MLANNECLDPLSDPRIKSFHKRAVVRIFSALAPELDRSSINDIISGKTKKSYKFEKALEARAFEWTPKIVGQPLTPDLKATVFLELRWEKKAAWLALFKGRNNEQKASKQFEKIKALIFSRPDKEKQLEWLVCNSLSFVIEMAFLIKQVHEWGAQEFGERSKMSSEDLFPNDWTRKANDLIEKHSFFAPHVVLVKCAADYLGGAEESTLRRWLSSTKWKEQPSTKQLEQILVDAGVHHVFAILIAYVLGLFWRAMLVIKERIGEKEVLRLYRVVALSGLDIFHCLFDGDSEDLASEIKCLLKRHLHENQLDHIDAEEYFGSWIDTLTRQQSTPEGVLHRYAARLNLRP